MEWNDEYSVGIQEIDDQHKRLLDIFSYIERGIRLQRGWMEIFHSVADLKIFARIHFEIEEALMRLYGFPALRAHIEEHQHFFTRLAEIESKALKGPVEKETLEFLCDWLKSHIQGSDRGYTDHILSGALVVRSGSATQSATALKRVN